MNKIYEEKKESLKFMLSYIEYNGKKIVELNPRNVALVEAMIANDSSYLKGMDKTQGPKGKYRGSAAFWITKLKSVLIDKKTSSCSYKELIYKIVCAIDAENSTHLNTDGVGRDEITQRICDIPKDKLIEYLKYPDKTELKIIDIISAKTNPKDKEKKARKNPSFASKFCHHTCYTLFENTEFQDNYSIYDNILKESIPFYIEYYGLSYKKSDLEDYRKYRKIIDEIIDKSQSGISRNGFDHLLWYYFKGRL